MTRTFFLTILLIGYCLGLRGQPIAAFTANRISGCSPLVVQFSNQTRGAGSGATYHWDLGNVNQVVATNPQAIYTIPGTYTITLTVQDGSQTSAATGTVTVDQPPTVNFSAVNTPVCMPTPIAFSASGTTGGGGTPGSGGSGSGGGTPGSGGSGSGGTTEGSSAIVSYLWDFGDGSTATTNGATASHVYTVTGTPGVSLTVTDADGCASTKTIPNVVTILPTLTAAFTTGQRVLCAATDPVTFTNTSAGPGTLTYQWAFGDGGSSVAAN